MISKQDINKLAELSRIELRESEAEKLSHEIDDILGYVKSIEGFHSEGTLEESGEGKGGVINVLREDINPTMSGTYTEAIIAEFPNTQDGYLKVKKIL